MFLSSDSSVTQLTFDQEVRSLLAVYESDLAFYTTANYSYETHLYAVSLTDSSHITCVSCLLREQLRDTEVANRECSVVSAVFSIKGLHTKYTYTVTISNADVRCISNLYICIDFKVLSRVRIGHA